MDAPEGERPEHERQERDRLANEVIQLRRQLAEAEHQNALLERRIQAASRDRVNQIIESAIDYAIIGLDLDGLVTSWNEGAHRLLGWTEEEMTGQPASRFFTLEDRRKGIPQAEMQTALLNDRGSDERWHLRRDGTHFWANGEMMPLRDEAGVIQGFVKILRDRTQQRLAAERHRADAEFLGRVLAASGDCINVLDLEANLVFMSEAGMRLLEIDDFNAIRGRPWPNLFQGLQRNAAFEAIENAKAGAVGHFQGTAHTMSGTPKEWDVQVTPILDADGNPERILTVSRDITQSRRAEVQRALLLELGDRLRDSDDPVAMTRATIEVLARALAAMSAGYATVYPGHFSVTIEQEWSPAEIEVPTQSFYIQNELSVLRQGQSAVVRDETTSILALPVLEQGGLTALFFITRTLDRIWTSDDIAFASDLVARACVAITQRRTEERVRNLAASLERQVEERTRERDRIWRVSRDLLGVATEAGVWISINPAWTATLGWLESEILGQSYERFVHPDDLPAARDEIISLAAGRPTVHFETRFKTRDDDYRWLSWSAVPVEGLFYCVGRDVTADRQKTEALLKTEEQLRQSQKMEAVGQLTGGLAHDFNNLLTGISGSLELLKLRISQGRLDQVERYIESAEGAAQRAAALTHRLLAFSRQQALDPRPTQPNRLILDMKDLIQRTVGPEISVETKLAPDLWTTLCDPNQLENAILNLAINARDAMPGGGRLTVETTNFPMLDGPPIVPDVRPGPYIVVSVSDTGTGMTPDVVARAFDPFFTTKPQGRGTGLGLSMIYGFTKQSGGRASITSSPGKGTTVYLYLPRFLGEEQQQSTPPEHATVALAQAGETVLIVDDEPSVRMLIQELLGEFGYAVIEAADGNTGLAVVNSDARIDLLITDVGLPGGVNGRQLAQIGRSRRPSLKVLFVTGYAEDAAVGAGPLEPGMAVLAKPFTIDALATRVRLLMVEQ